MAHGDHGHDHDHDHVHGHGHAHAHGHEHGHVHHAHGHPHAGAEAAHHHAVYHHQTGAHALHHGHAAADAAPRIHRAAAPRIVRVGVVTASDTRDESTDTSGRYLRDTLADHGQLVVHRTIVPDEPERVRLAVAAAAAAGAEVVIVTGGTGISRRDSTFEAIDGLLARRLPGFGELFRLLSFQEIGSAAMLSRATAGVTADGLIIFAIPGSTGACRTALERLILPELGHLVAEVQK